MDYKNLMFRTLSPSGAPIQFGDIISGLKAELFSGKQSIEIFTKQFAAYLDCENLYLLSSGKAALALVLKALSTISDRKEVIIPAYSSFCLASAIAATGLSVKLCDIDREYLDFDLDHLSRLVDKKTLAVIPVHLFGLVARLEEIAKITKSKKAFLVEDAAQAVGAEYNGQSVGTIGDVGIFSLGRGKCISTVHGGVITVNNKSLVDVLERDIGKIPQMDISGKLNILFSAIAIIFFLWPQLYCIPANLPFLQLGANIYEPDFQCFDFTNLQAGIGSKNFHRLDAYNRKRRENASFLTNCLQGCDNLTLPRITRESKPCFTRFPVYCTNKKLREKKYDALVSAGLGVSKNYPYPLIEIKGFSDLVLNSTDLFPNSSNTCDTLLTLPTHPFVKEKDIIKMMRILTHFTC